jgi:hypothetical protein
MSRDIETTLIGALAGATASLIVNLLMGSWKIWQLHRNIGFHPQPPTGTRGTVRIHNGYKYPLNNVYAYITIDHVLDDVLEPPEPFDSYISRNHLYKVQEDRLCWSSTAPSTNPPVLDIYAGEKQALDIVNFDPRGQWIEIPSEKGWATSQDSDHVRQMKQNGENDGIKKSRVFLRPRKYKAIIKIVSKDTKAKEFRIEIDPTNREAPLKALD